MERQNSRIANRENNMIEDDMEVVAKMMRNQEITNVDMEYCQRAINTWTNNKIYKPGEQITIVTKETSSDWSSGKKKNTEEEEFLCEIENNLKRLKNELILFDENNHDIDRLKYLESHVRKLNSNFLLIKPHQAKEDFPRIKQIQETFTFILEQITEILNQNEATGNSAITEEILNLDDVMSIITKNEKELSNFIDQFEQNEDFLQDETRIGSTWVNSKREKVFDSVVQHGRQPLNFRNMSEKKDKNLELQILYEKTFQHLVKIESDVFKLRAQLTKNNCQITKGKIICLKGELNSIEEINQEIIEKKSAISSLIRDIEITCEDYEAQKNLDLMEWQRKELNFSGATHKEDEEIIQKQDMVEDKIDGLGVSSNRNSAEQTFVSFSYIVIKDKPQQSVSKIDYGEQKVTAEDKKIQNSDFQKVMVEIEVDGSNPNQKSNVTTTNQQINKIEIVKKTDNDLKIWDQNNKGNSKNSEQTFVSLSSIIGNKPQEKSTLDLKIQFAEQNVILDEEMVQNSEEIQQVSMKTINDGLILNQKSNEAKQKLEDIKIKLQNHHFSVRDEDENSAEALKNQGNIQNNRSISVAFKNFISSHLQNEDQENGIFSRNFEL